MQLDENYAFTIGVFFAVVALLGSLQIMTSCVDRSNKHTLECLALQPTSDKCGRIGP